MTDSRAPAGNLPILLFENQDAWGIWLERNHAVSPGVWLRLAKKGSGAASVSYAEALEVALCYGWIDGHKRRGDENTWLHKFTRRARKSIWSKINREKALALVRSGRMKPSGLQEIERAQQDGRWEAAYDSARGARVPEDFQTALDRNARAKANFAALDGANRYAFLFRIQTVKRPETRARRIEQFIRMLEKNEKIHPGK